MARRPCWAKLRDSIVSLKNSSEALKGLKATIREKSLLSELAEVTAEADQRRKVMEDEHSAWQSRVHHQTGPEDSKPWYTDETGRIRSKLIPTWPSPEHRR